jgi:hypothetical protein
MRTNNVAGVLSLSGDMLLSGRGRGRGLVAELVKDLLGVLFGLVRSARVAEGGLVSACGILEFGNKSMK